MSRFALSGQRLSTPGLGLERLRRFLTSVPACVMGGVAWSIEDEFLLGDALLVAPVLDASERRRIWFPPGCWIDCWTGAEHAGEGWEDHDAPLEILPLFVRRVPGAPEGIAQIPIPCPVEDEP